MAKHFRVTVAVDGEEVLAIETNMLAGVSNIDEYADEIRTCAAHLLSFIGPENPEPFDPGEPAGRSALEGEGRHE